MRSRGGRERPAAVFGRGLALASVLALSLVGPGRTPARGAGGKAARTPTIYHKSRNFRIPFNVDAADRPRLREVQLYVSNDSGYHWEKQSVTTPDRPLFSYRATHDGEYWFAVRTVDTKGRVFPGDDETTGPSMIVFVDTNPPALVLEPDGRRGSLAAVRWDIKDEHIDPKSLTLEYQAEGARDWRTLPIRRFGLIGGESWDAGTAEPLKVRASVADKAGNVTEAVISIPEGTPSPPGTAAADAPEFASPPPVSQISTGPNPAFPPRDDFPRAGGGGNGAASPASDPFPFPNDPGPAPGSAASPPAGGGMGAGMGVEGDPFGGPGGPAPAPSTMGAGSLTPPPAAAAAGAAPATQLINSTKFPLQYAVDDAGPNGPAMVELYVTYNGGRTWTPAAEDPDRKSPIDVDLGAEGTYGLRLVARSASGLGHGPPAPGDPPHLVVQVDTTPPDVRMQTPVAGTGVHFGKVAIFWTAQDLHLRNPRPVSLFWRDDKAGSAWQSISSGLPNTGRYIWTVPTGVPPRFHVKVEVVDDAGNPGAAETPEGAPVLLDRTRPRTRILGLDPRARTGMGMRPGTGPVR